MLSIYVAALTLLLLGGVSMQRTATEVRAAELSRDMHQAFYLAEGGLDQALQSGVIEATDEGTAPSGTFRYTAGPSQIEVVSPKIMRTTYTLTATGIASNRDATVSGLIVKEAPLSGAFAQGKVSGAGGGCANGLEIAGHLHSGSGVPASIVLSGENGLNRVYGDVSVGKRATPGFNDVWGLYDGHDPANLFWGDDPGMSLKMTPGASSPAIFALYVAALGSEAAAREYLRKEVVKGDISSVPLAEIQPAPSPYAHLTWQGGFTVGPVDIAKRLVISNPGTRRDIYDGDPTWDGTPAGDGQISMRVSTLQLWKDTQLVFHAPTTIYIERSETITPNSIGYVAASVQLVRPTDIAVYAGENTVLTSVDGAGKTVKGGVELIVAKRTDNKPAGNVLVTEPDAFIASVWAPQSTVAMSGRLYRVGKYDSESNSYVDLLYADPRLGGPPLELQTCWGDYCPWLPGEVGGTQSRYVVSNDLYLTGGVAIGLAGNQPPIVEDEASDDPTLSMWKLGPLE